MNRSGHPETGVKFALVNQKPQERGAIAAFADLGAPSAVIWPENTRITALGAPSI
jgi:hypothetical protein